MAKYIIYQFILKINNKVLIEKHLLHLIVDEILKIMKELIIKSI